MTECVEGIYLSHALNIVHLDIKAENIFLDRFEHGKKVGHAKIGDFGIANQVENRYTTTDKGSVHFVPPEVWMGDHFKFEPDCFALGVLFYQMLAGKMPFDSPDMDEISRQIIEDDWDHVPFSKLPNDYFLKGKEEQGRTLIIKILTGMLQKERKKRFSIIDIIGICIGILL